MTGAQILAIGGIISAGLTAVGGWAGLSGVIGLAGALMLTANVAALYAERGRTRR
jgi:hypothetical protein